MTPLHYNRARPWRGRLLIAVVVLGLYVAACATPAVGLDRNEGKPAFFRLGPLSGLLALMVGWIPPLCIPWSANWLLVGGWGLLLARQFRAAAWMGAAGAGLALTTWCFDVPRLLVGYYLWQGSLVVLAAGAAALAWRERGGRIPPEFWCPEGVRPNDLMLPFSDGPRQEQVVAHQEGVADPTRRLHKP